MSDEEIDSIIQDFIARHGQPQAKLTYEDTFEQWGTLYKGGGSEKAWTR